jgi:tetratricopeptide (TPR) repeat protein
MSSGLNIGARHILPLYAFLTVLLAGAAWTFFRRGRPWRFAIAALLLFHAVSSARAFPTYLAYSNELWGGPASTYKYLTDSNADWAQQLKGVSKYLQGRGVKDCWFAYFAQVVVHPSDYGIPCKVLPSVSSLWLREVEPVPPVIVGPVLISAATLSGYETGPGAVNPYDSFQRLRPAAIIEDGVLVFDGRFAIPLASAITHAYRASELLAAHQPEAALAEAQTAVSADPDSVRALLALGDSLRAIERPDEARSAYEKALHLARTVEPAFQEGWIKTLETRLRGTAGGLAGK